MASIGDRRAVPVRARARRRRDDAGPGRPARGPRACSTRPRAAGRTASSTCCPGIVAAGNVSRVGLARVVVEDGVPDRRRAARASCSSPTAAGSTADGNAGVEDPRVTWVEALGLHVMTYVAYGPLGPRTAIAVSTDLRSWDRLGPVRLPLGRRRARRPTSTCSTTRTRCSSPSRSPRRTATPSLAVLHRPMGMLRPFRGETRPRRPRPGRPTSARASGSASSRWTTALADLRALTVWRGHRFLAGPEQPVRGAQDRRRPAAAAGARGLAAAAPRRHRRDRRAASPSSSSVHYAAGGMLLDAERPWQVVARSTEPLLEPSDRRRARRHRARTSSSPPPSRRSTASTSSSTAWPTPRSASPDSPGGTRDRTRRATSLDPSSPLVRRVRSPAQPAAGPRAGARRAGRRRRARAAAAAAATTTRHQPRAPRLPARRREPEGGRRAHDLPAGRGAGAPGPVDLRRPQRRRHLPPGRRRRRSTRRPATTPRARSTPTTSPAPPSSTCGTGGRPGSADSRDEGVRAAARDRVPADDHRPERAARSVLWMQPDGDAQPERGAGRAARPVGLRRQLLAGPHLWAFGEGYAAFEQDDPAFAAFLRDRIRLSVRCAEPRRPRRATGATTVADGVKVPAWLIVDGADATAEAVLGLSAYVGAAPSDRLARDALRKLARGIAAMATDAGRAGRTARCCPGRSRARCGTPGARSSRRRSPAARRSLGDRRCCEPAVTEAVRFDPTLLTSGGADNGWLPDARSTRVQIAYGVDSRVQSLLAVADTGGTAARARPGRDGGVAGSSAPTGPGKPMYDPATGVTFDGLEADGADQPQQRRREHDPRPADDARARRAPVGPRPGDGADRRRRAATACAWSRPSRRPSTTGSVVTPESAWTGESSWSGGTYLALKTGQSATAGPRRRQRPGQRRAGDVAGGGRHRAQPLDAGRPHARHPAAPGRRPGHHGDLRRPAPAVARQDREPGRRPGHGGRPARDGPSRRGAGPAARLAAGPRRRQRHDAGALGLGARQTAQVVPTGASATLRVYDARVVRSRAARSPRRAACACRRTGSRWSRTLIGDAGPVDMSEVYRAGAGRFVEVVRDLDDRRC